MRRLVVVAVGTALAAALAFGAGAFALHVWPGQEADPSPRYTFIDAIGIVRTSLVRNVQCEGYGSGWKPRWGAEFQDRGTWLVGAWCINQPGIQLIQGIEVTETLWRLYEDSGQVIPLTDSAVALMQP